TVTESEGRAVVNFGHLCWQMPRDPCRIFPQDDKTVIRRVDGVANVSEAKEHFRRTKKIDLDDRIRELKANRVLDDRSYPFARVLAINMGELGYVPGGMYYYCFLRMPRRATLLINPSNGTRIDFAKSRVEAKR
ncbi:MAG TPA: hypothetical protein VN878_04345, partial [Usitatibacter sp.]|nr:hypothetical protein [Usitatibacter sp.]